uniref:S-locus F-box protein n=1 Tax=Solanum peruvianum TaxID=4082 RepID=A0A2R2WEI5_SOLPE|nr:S-locus F-box protein [Solanum peruvianum]
MAGGNMKNLCDDMLINILLRIPVKSLIRFKCISKILYDLIQSSIFINLHRNRSIIKDELLLLKRSIKVAPLEYNNVLSFLSGHDDNINDLKPVYPDLYIPRLTSRHGHRCYETIGPCNGLIVLTDFDAIVLFNPATRNYRALPLSPFKRKVRFHRSMRGGLGFGYDWIANDYKFVKLSEIFRDPPQWHPNEDREKTVEIYDLNIGSWRVFDYDCEELPSVHWLPCFEIFYKGAYHWSAYAETPIILCFDMTSETFRGIYKMPHTCHPYDAKIYSLVILNESLTLICYAGKQTVLDPIRDLTDIWVLKEYGVYESWIKKYTIKPLYIEATILLLKDHLLLLQSFSGQVMSNDLNSDKLEEVHVFSSAHSFTMIIYKECLTPVPKMEDRVEHNSMILEKVYLFNFNLMNFRHTSKFYHFFLSFVSANLSLSFQLPP